MPGGFQNSQEDVDNVMDKGEQLIDAPFEVVLGEKARNAIAKQAMNSSQDGEKEPNNFSQISSLNVSRGLVQIQTEDAQLQQVEQSSSIKCSSAKHAQLPLTFGKLREDE